MKQHLVFSLLGRDRAGLVNRVTDVLTSSRANLEDSRMATLGGEFAMMILCSVDSAATEALVERMDAAARELELLLTHKLTDPRAPRPGQTTLEVQVRGADHEGIVHELVHHMVGHGVSVDTLESKLVNAPYSGVPQFEMTMLVSAPASLSTDGLREQLQTLGDGLNVDVSVETIARPATPAAV